MTTSTQWINEILRCPTTGSAVSGSWPHLSNASGEPIVVEESGIVLGRQKPGLGVDFHDRMERGTTLRELQHVPLQLAYWETPYYATAIADFLSSAQGISCVADIGCGDGRFTRHLIDSGISRVVCVDANLHSLRSLANHAEKTGMRDRLLLIRADADDLPLAPESVDAALAAGVLYYLNERYEQGLSAVCRIIRPGGSLIASEPDLEGASLKALLFEGLDDFITSVAEKRFSEMTGGEKFKFRLFSRAELEQQYARNGLVVISHHGISIFPSLVRIGLVSGQLSQEDLFRRESELRGIFDYFDQHGAVFKHIVWHCRKKE
jgi:ubiquinone/menaquinone biosynthesis C-methylase UbiE